MELYTLKTEEGVTSQGMQASLEIGKGITIHSSLELLSKSPMSWLTDSSQAFAFPDKFQNLLVKFLVRPYCGFVQKYIDSMNSHFGKN